MFFKLISARGSKITEKNISHNHPEGEIPVLIRKKLLWRGGGPLSPRTQNCLEQNVLEVLD